MRHLTLIEEGSRDKKIDELLRELRRLRREISRVLKCPVVIDYEEWVRQRSIELFGKVKEFYNFSETAKILGVTRTFVHYRAKRGVLKTFAGRIPFKEVVLLAEYYSLKELEEAVRNELCGQGSERDNYKT